MVKMIIVQIVGTDWCRVEKVGSELTAAEVAQHHDLVVRAKKNELNGIMKHDAMKAVRKAECTTKSITSR